MADQTPSAGGASKPTEKKDTVRITLPPRPVPPSSAGAPPPGGASKLPSTIPAAPIMPKKETSRLKKTTGNVAGATKPAAPAVPPPTVRAQPLSQPPSTIAASVPAAPASSAATAVARPTVKLQTADIPKIPSPPAPVSASSSPAQPAPVMVEQSGPALLDVILSVLVMVFSGVAAYLLFMAHGS